MKIAVYIVGQWRGTAYQCAENLKKIFDKFDTDYYINIYPFYEGKNLNLSQYDIQSNPIVEHENYTHSEQDLENIKNTYNNVVSMQVESYYEVKNTNSLHSTFFQYYCAYRANEIRKAYEINNDIKYDVIIKIRPDIIFGDMGIESFIERIKYIKNNPETIFSFYTTRQNDLKPDTHLVWDFYTISNSFSMDCMTEWVGEIINKGNIPEIFSSNSIIKNNLILNTDVLKANTLSPELLDVPSPQLMREGYKYNNLVEDFYNQMSLCKNNPNDQNFTLHLINDYLYNFNITNDSIVEWFKKINLENKEPKFVNRGLNSGWNKFLTESELKELSDLIKSKINENNIHAKDN
jgi:hypothetical protein